MIEVTRLFKAQNQQASPTNEMAASNDDSLSETTSAEISQLSVVTPKSDTNAMDRRAWLSSLVPAFGDGLVKILRTSNHLKNELKENTKLTR